MAVLPAAWWLIGDLSEPDPGSGLDHSFGKLAIDRRIETVVGSSALVVAVVAAVLVVGRSTNGRTPRRWLLGVGVLTAANVAAAFGGRVLMAGTNGANIGGGFVLLFGVPALVVTYAWGLTLIRRSDGSRT